MGPVAGLAIIAFKAERYRKESTILQMKPSSDLSRRGRNARYVYTFEVPSMDQTWTNALTKQQKYTISQFRSWWHSSTLRLCGVGRHPTLTIGKYYLLMV